MGGGGIVFENMTFENLLKMALSKVNDSFDKRQGSIIYDAIAPICAVLAQAYIDLEIVLKEGFADTCSREYLIKRAKERGIYPYSATNSIILVSMTGDFSLTGGERFNLDTLNFYYTGEMEKGHYKLCCETSGTIGNVSYGTLLPIDNIQGLESAEIVCLFSEASDEESTEYFRKRYFESFESKSFGGNRADYINKLISLNEDEKVRENGGIGGVKIYRTPLGGGSVEIFITNNSHKVPTSRLINIVQEEIDPLDSSGEGLGIAPIGHKVSIKPVFETKVNITTNVTLKTGFSIDDIRQNIDDVIEKYLQDLRENWQNEDIIIRISMIDSIILDINGVLDIENTSINGSYENLQIEKNSIPIKEEIDVN